MKAICIVKSGFDTRKLAKKVAKQLLSEVNIKLVAYKCPYCQYFHLTSKIKMSYKVRARE